MRGDPRRQRGRPAFRCAEHRGAGDVAVPRKVVAAQHRERGEPGETTGIERGGDDAERRARRRGSRIHSQRVIADERARHDGIPALGDGERDDLRRRGAERGEERRRVVVGCHDIRDRSDDAARHRVALTLDDRVQPTLSTQHITHSCVVCHDAGTGDGPG